MPGYLQSDLPRATSHDVARLAGVSQPTVSRALRDDGRISQRTCDRVREAARQLNYVPSRRGRSLSTSRTGQIAVVVADLRNPFYAEAIHHLHTAANTGDAKLVVFAAPSDEPVDSAALLDGSIDGAVLTSEVLGSRLPVRLREAGVPVVQLNQAVDGPIADACVSDNFTGGERVAQELADLGHRRVGLIAGPTDTSTGRDREAGFRAGLEKHGLPLDDSLIRRGPFTFETGVRGMTELLATKKPPSAVFCGNDVIGLGALNVAYTAGISVPADLTVIGFDNIPMAAWDTFSLSTVTQDLPRMCELALQLLFERIEDPSRDVERILLPASFVRRRSLGRTPRAWYSDLSQMRRPPRP